MQLKRLALAALVAATVAVPVPGAAGATAEPPYTATPRAACGAGSRPLVGVQGRVPKAAIDSKQAVKGWTCNLRVAGHYTSSGGYKVWSYADARGRACAFYDTTLLYPMDASSGPGPGVYVLDMTNSARPVLTARLTEPGMLSPHESLNLHAGRGLLAAELGQTWPYPGLMSIYDVRRDCRHPVLDSTYRAARFGHESEFSPDGRTFWITGGIEGLAAVDVSNPRSPRTLAEVDENVHGGSVSADGNRFYASDAVHADLATFDVSDVQARRPNPQIREMSRFTWRRATIPQSSVPMTVHGHRYLLEFDEFAYRYDGVPPPDTVGAARIIDLADQHHPSVASNIRLQVNNPPYRTQADGDPGGISGNNAQTGYAAHYCSIPRTVDPQIAACTFINSGLRVFDIRDPRHPREVAYFVSPPKASWVNGNEASDTAVSRPAFYPKRREVWFTDAASGFWAVRLDRSVWPG